jgi:hypothetical protein
MFYNNVSLDKLNLFGTVNIFAGGLEKERLAALARMDIPSADLSVSTIAKLFNWRLPPVIFIKVCSCLPKSDARKLELDEANELLANLVACVGKVFWLAATSGSKNQEYDILF